MRLPPLRPCLLFLALVSTSSRISSQATWRVDESAALGARDGTSWANAFLDLQDALGASSAGDAIWVAAGTYRPDPASRTATFAMKSGVELFGGFPSGGGGGTFAARDPAQHMSILSGDVGLLGVSLDNSFHVVTGSSTNSTALLDGFLVRGGRADGNGTNRQGGGMVVRGGSPTIRNCRFEGNHADTDGGGLATFGSPRVLNCVFIQNTAFGRGGGIFNDGGSQEILNCTFYGNAAGTTGGGLHNLSQSSSITNCIVWGNVGSSIGGSPVVTFCNVQGGHAGAGNLSKRPRFVDPAGGDLHLRRRSACIDTGTTGANLPLTDADGEERVQGGSVDMGAFEFRYVWSYYPTDSC